MINSIVKAITGREIILYNPHRNSNPLLNAYNKKRFLFINPHWILKSTFFLGRNSRLRYRTMSTILSLINPAFILDINWISKLQSLYYVWCRRNGKKFVVVQHGSQYGGVFLDIDHKYTKCHIFLVWGTYFKELMEEYNPEKNVEIVVYGNTVYNQYDRSEFMYKKKIGNKILVAVSLIKGERFRRLNQFLQNLAGLGFDIVVKEHSFQSTKSDPFEGVKKIEKGSASLYELLESREYDVVISDVSTALNDAIFFKNRVLFYSPEGDSDYYVNNVYSGFLKNVYYHENEIISSEDVYKFIDIDTQENLLDYMIETKGKHNRLDLLL